jgi:MFS transporter, SP family, arabinose:H+ symporter
LNLPTTPARRWPNPRAEAAKLSSSSVHGHSRGPLLIAASVSTLSGLLFGYDNIVISGAIGYLSQLFHLDAAGTGWAAGCALIGCIIGCAAAGTVADYLGKKKGLALCAVCFALSSAGMLFAANLHQFVTWRLIGGVGIGAASVISPNYIAEIAPTRVRGRCVTLYQLGIVVGILAAVFVNMLIQRMGDEAWNTSAGWRWMFFAGIVPALLFGGMIYPAVESPRWLMKMGRRDQAIRVLAQINDPEIADHESAEIENSLVIEEGTSRNYSTPSAGPCC